MPYIAPEAREEIEPALKAFATDIRDRLGDDLFFGAGTLAYIVYRLMTLFADRSSLYLTEKVRWRDHARVWADVVLGASYYKRDCIDPYEDAAAEENGNITTGWGDNFLTADPPPEPNEFDDEIPF